ncbi:hypothetical protein PtA15_1A11 [Puccinia triticina]|uniref:gluconokinase n=1 Tax=Puccinia triticina TaxID=208348 RepID=A0ABY7C722_9BASI|nr:uncharacterized protein PtA15_1A11 [Puccinia triticina]WAQ80673.1 hypothetical protein PtA15_1A11 [Puccinia triticina]
MAENVQQTLLVVGGVSGSGKSTFGVELARRLNIPFLDGDDLHPPSNIEKMKSGKPLDDFDREPWLDNIRTKALEMIEHLKSFGQSDHKDGQPLAIVIACSALKRRYRDMLRGFSASAKNVSKTAQSDCQVHFIHLSGDPELIRKRLQDRKNHFVGSDILASQLDTLQEPDPGQENSPQSQIFTISLSFDDCQPKSVEEMVNEAMQELADKTGLPMPELAQFRQQSPVQLPSLQTLFDPEPGQLQDVLALLFEVSDSIENKLIPILRENLQNKLPNSYSELIDHCQDIVENRFDRDEQVNFLGSHPRIGAVKGLSKLSSKEQGNQADPAVLNRLAELNALYEKLYPGLRYVTFVNGRSRAEIVEEMEDLITKDAAPTPAVHLQDKNWQAELKRGIRDVFQIANSRLKSITESS